MSDTKVSEAFALIAELASALGVKNIKDLPGPWIHQIDQHWKIAVNGTDHGVEHEYFKIAPYCMGVWYNDFPAALFNIRGEGQFAMGSVVNEDAFIEALHKAIQIHTIRQ